MSRTLLLVGCTSPFQGKFTVLFDAIPTRLLGSLPGVNELAGVLQSDVVVRPVTNRPRPVPSDMRG